MFAMRNITSDWGKDGQGQRVKDLGSGDECEIRKSQLERMRNDNAIITAGRDKIFQGFFSRTSPCPITLSDSRYYYYE